MATQKLRPQDLVIRSRCLHVNGFFIRQIDNIEGDTVIYHDQYGPGRCSMSAFLKRCPAVASEEAEALPCTATHPGRLRSQIPDASP